MNKLEETKARELEEQTRRLWQREGGHCVSSLVNTLAKQSHMLDRDRHDDLYDLAEQAFELSCPIDDWEEAAMQEGWELRYHLQDEPYFIKEGEEEHPSDDWRELCEANGIEPYQREVFEHWIVSDWLADKLAEKGEKIDKDFAGLTIWARTTTGQAVYCDWVIEQIAKDLHDWREV